MRKALHLHSFSGMVAWHRTLRKALHLHSFSSQPSSSTFLGPNLPDVWVPRQNTSPHTLLPQSLQWTDNDDHSAAILEGKQISKQIKLKVADEISRMKNDMGKFPRLAVVLVGDRRDSHTFINVKSKACEKVGIETVVSQLAENCTENELCDVVSSLNDDQDVHGIIVQLPLPQHLNEERIMNIVSPEKDVDGFHPLNIGNLARSGRKPFFIPCASKSCIELLLNHGIEIRGKRVAIIGRGKIAGLPTSLLLQRHHATVSLLHAYTKNPERITSEADIVVTDVGIPNIVRGDWIKKGAVVIDMGTNQVKESSVTWIIAMRGTNVSFYPGGASIEIHQALTRSKTIRNILPRHEQGGVFAAEGYARSSGLLGICIGLPGICIATSGPGATNLVGSLADALMDSVPLIAITGQVPRRMIGTDAFQETPIVEVTRSITEHNYLIFDVEDIAKVVKEAFFIATFGHPGPVLIDVPKDVQQQLTVPYWSEPIMLTGYLSRLPKIPGEAQLEQVLRLLLESKKPVLYIGGGCLNSREELNWFVELTGVPVASTLMGLGSYSIGGEHSLSMLGMHGTVYANYTVDNSDLLLASGVRFDDRVTRKVEAFASRAKIVHIDIDSAEKGKNKIPHVSICADMKVALEGLNRLLERKGIKGKLEQQVDEKDPSSQVFRVTGDVCFEEAVKVASAITPVPGGVGPVTVSMLLSNTLDSAKRAFGII